MAAKIFKTIDEQIEILRSKGMVFEDYDKAREILKKRGYITRTDYDWKVLHKVVAEARNNIKVVE